MKEAKERALAKINLSLDILGRRPDGYHDLRMVMQTIGLCDELTLQVCGTPGITLQVSPASAKETVPEGEDNLACRAARLLMEEFSVREGLSIALYKRIPAAAGLAGGSADAAAVLRGVNNLFGLGLSQEELMRRGVQIGADVPYCVLGGTALAEGIGEKLTPLPRVPQACVLLVKPPVSVPTGPVYTRYDSVHVPDHPDIDAQMRAIAAHDLRGVAASMGNVLELVTVPAYPVIGELIGRMKELGAAGAGMSGSGPAVFGLFEDRLRAEKACEVFRKEEPEQEVFLTEFAFA